MLLQPVKTHFFMKWLHPRFYEAVSDLECFSCENFWTPAKLKQVMAAERSSGLIVSDRMTPIGFVVFTRRGMTGKIGKILNLVVHPEHRRVGWGSFLLAAASTRLKENCCSIRADVRESNLGAHLFFKANQFRATAVKRGFFQDCYQDYIEQEDGFQFVWRNHE